MVDTEKTKELPLTFKDVRKLFGLSVPVSICMKETLSYKNYGSVMGVPKEYDEYYVYGFGPVTVEFHRDGRDIRLRPAMEIMLTRKPRAIPVEAFSRAKPKFSFGLMRHLCTIVDPIIIADAKGDSVYGFRYVSELHGEFDRMRVVSIGMELCNESRPHAKELDVWGIRFVLSGNFEKQAIA